MKNSNKNWLERMSRQKLNQYIKNCERLVRECGNDLDKKNFSIYKTWLDNAEFESLKRYEKRSMYLQYLKKRS